MDDEGPAAKRGLFLLVNPCLIGEPLLDRRALLGRSRFIGDGCSRNTRPIMWEPLQRRFPSATALPAEMPCPNPTSCKQGTLRHIATVAVFGEGAND